MLSVQCDNVPQGMTALTKIEVHPGNMTIGWTALTSPTLNGGDLPIFYSVEFASSQAPSTWTVLNSYTPGDPVSLNYTYVLPGTIIFNENYTYYYRVRA